MANDFVIQGTSGLRLTTDVVQIDANRQAYRLLSVDRGVADIPVGALFQVGTAGEAVAIDGSLVASTPAINAPREVLIRISKTNTSSTNVTQDITEDGGAVFSSNLTTSFAGLKGSGIRVGLPFDASLFIEADVASGDLETPGQYLVLKLEDAGAAVRPSTVKYGLAGGATTGGLIALSANEVAFGIVERVEGGQILWFNYSNTIIERG